jgi:hypothetical protein
MLGLLLITTLPHPQASAAIFCLVGWQGVGLPDLAEAVQALANCDRFMIELSDTEW